MLTQAAGETPTTPAARGKVLPFRMTRKRSAALSSLLDQATQREEEAAQLAAYYSQQAARHRAIRRALETLIP